MEINSIGDFGRLILATIAQARLAGNGDAKILQAIKRLVEITCEKVEAFDEEDDWSLNCLEQFEKCLEEERDAVQET